MTQPLREIKSDIKDIEKTIERGILFIKKNQMPAGEFPTYISSHEDMKEPHYIKTVSMALLVASSLKHAKTFSSEAGQIIVKSIQFVLAEREDDIKWKFFCRGSNIVPDLDDTSYALALLLENNIKLDYEKSANEMLQYRDESGIFYTWFRKMDNNIDWVTNTNILYFYNLLRKRMPEVEYYLKEIIKSRLFEKGSLYYKNPFSFIYFFTRLYSDGKMETFKTELSILIDFLLKEFSFSRGWGDPFKNILATTALINSGYNGQILKPGIKIVLAEQEKDGGWPIGQMFNHRSINHLYGSRELSTSLAIEGLTKYFMRQLPASVK